MTNPGGTGRPAAASRLRLAPFPPATDADCAVASSKKRIASAKNLHEPGCAVQPDTLPGFNHLCGGPRADDRRNAELARDDSRVRQRAARICHQRADFCEEH